MFAVLTGVSNDHIQLWRLIQTLADAEAGYFCRSGKDGENR